MAKWESKYQSKWVKKFFEGKNDATLMKMTKAEMLKAIHDIAEKWDKAEENLLGCIRASNKDAQELVRLRRLADKIGSRWSLDPQDEIKPF